MLFDFQKIVKKKLQQTIHNLFQIEKFEYITIEYPPNPTLGDFSSPVVFELAKYLGKSSNKKTNPRLLAQQLIAGLGVLDGIARIEIAGAGYLNFFLNKGNFLKEINLNKESFKLVEQINGKIIVEHTSINPNKAAHVGHLRNAVLGDTVVRLLRASGEEVEVHNYIDNTGVQVADVVAGFRYIENKSLADIHKITNKFDYYCWDLYAQVGKFYEEDPEKQQLRAKVLHDIEHNLGETAEIAEYISSKILECHLKTMWRLGIAYEVLPRESEIIHLKFWQTAFEKLKTIGAIYFETEGHNKGCWVMSSDKKIEEQTTQLKDDDLKQELTHEVDKILVRSNGTVTYTGKDIAYHLWKLGKLGLDFNYRPFYTYSDGTTAWISASSDQVEANPKFGNGSMYINVIDVGQSYPQAYVKLAMKMLNPDTPLERSGHLAYEKVTLTTKSAVEMGYKLSEDDSKRNQVNMSGRKGLGVKVDDLIDKLQEKALKEVTLRHQEESEQERKYIANQIAVGALRYFLLKYTRISSIAFDFDEVLAFEGETGPYIQYAVVRINSMFSKLNIDKQTINECLKNLSLEEIEYLFNLKDEATGWDGQYLWALLCQANRLKDVINTSIKSLEPTYVAKYTYQIASNFNEFYNIKNAKGKVIYKLVSETDINRQYLLIILVKYIQQQLESALELLGIEIPDKM